MNSLAIIVASILACTTPAVGQQTSRRAHSDPAPAVDKVLSTVRYRTPTIELRESQPRSQAELIPDSDSSRRPKTHVPLESTDDIHELKSKSEQLRAVSHEMKPTLSPNQRFAVKAPSTGLSLRRNPLGNRVGAPFANSKMTGSETEATTIQEPRMAQIPRQRLRLPVAMQTGSIQPPPLPAGGFASPRIPMGQSPQIPVPQLRLTATLPIVQPDVFQKQDIRPQRIETRNMTSRREVPHVDVQRQLASQNANPKSIVDSLKGLKFSNAKHFLSKNPQFKDPKQFLAQPARPAGQSHRAATITRQRPPRQQPPIIEARQKNLGTVREIVTDQGRQESQLLPTQRPEEAGVFNDFADVRDPIPAVPLADLTQSDPSKLLIDDRPLESDLIYGADRFNYAQLTGSPNVPSGKAWLAPDFYHRPLYFEEPNMERYGNRLPMQVFVSAAHFFATIPLLPYKMGAQPPYQCTYAYGNCRPGDCVPYQVRHRPFDRKGAFWQALITTAIVVP